MAIDPQHLQAIIQAAALGADVTTTGLNLAQLGRMILNRKHKDRVEAFRLLEETAARLAEVRISYDNAIKLLETAQKQNLDHLKETIKDLDEDGEKLTRLTEKLELLTPKQHAARTALAGEIAACKLQIALQRERIKTLGWETDNLVLLEEQTRQLALQLQHQSHDLAEIARAITAKYGRK